MYPAITRRGVMLHMKSQVKPEYVAPGSSPKQDLLGSLCFTSQFSQKHPERFSQIRSYENFALIPLVLIHVATHSCLYLRGKCLQNTCAAGSSSLRANTHLLWLCSELKVSFWGREYISLCCQTTHRNMELIVAGGDRSGHNRSRECLQWQPV